MKFIAQSISCNHCVNAITQSIMKQDPKAQVNVDVKSHSVTVQTSKSESIILQAIKDAGFDDVITA